jgi:hypothetical protein
MLSNTLNTNEVKNAAAAEVEFNRLSTEGRKTVFSQITESPNLPHRLTVSHQENGSGVKLRRRSVVRIDKTVISGVDSVTPITVSAYIVLDAPVGGMTAITEATNALAELGSFAFTNASATFLYDGTGPGISALLNGGL